MRDFGDKDEEFGDKYVEIRSISSSHWNCEV